MALGIIEEQHLINIADAIREKQVYIDVTQNYNNIDTYFTGGVFKLAILSENNSGFWIQLQGPDGEVINIYDYETDGFNKTIVLDPLKGNKNDWQVNYEHFGTNFTLYKADMPGKLTLPEMASAISNIVNTTVEGIEFTMSTQPFEIGNDYSPISAMKFYFLNEQGVTQNKIIYSGQSNSITAPVGTFVFGYVIPSGAKISAIGGPDDYWTPIESSDNFVVLFVTNYENINTLYIN